METSDLQPFGQNHRRQHGLETGVSGGKQSHGTEPSVRELRCYLQADNVRTELNRRTSSQCHTTSGRGERTHTSGVRIL